MRKNVMEENTPFKIDICSHWSFTFFITMPPLRKTYMISCTTVILKAFLILRKLLASLDSFY